MKYAQAMIYFDFSSDNCPDESSLKSDKDIYQI